MHPFDLIRLYCVLEFQCPVRCAVPKVEGSPRLARFKNFELDLQAGELRQKDGKIVRLPEQPFQILLTLLEHPGEIVSREEIRKRLWPNDTVVEFEHSISAAGRRNKSCP